MANWAWPHTPADNWARIRLVGGPFDGVEAAFVPPDTSSPIQVVWSGWFPWGFDACLYEWHGETTIDRGRTDSLIFRPSGHRIAADRMPPVLAVSVEMWADAADLVSRVLDVPPDRLWPGL